MDITIKRLVDAFGDGSVAKLEVGRYTLRLHVFGSPVMLQGDDEYDSWYILEVDKLWHDGTTVYRQHIKWDTLEQVATYINSLPATL